MARRSNAAVAVTPEDLAGHLATLGEKLDILVSRRSLFLGSPEAYRAAARGKIFDPDETARAMAEVITPEEHDALFAVIRESRDRHTARGHG